MNSKLLSTILSSCFCLISSSYAQSFKHGRLKSATCTSCHGADGYSLNPSWPHIAGQNEEYLYQQLKAYKNGERKNSIMNNAVSFLSDQDLKDLAKYFAELPHRREDLNVIRKPNLKDSIRDIMDVSTPESVYFDPQTKNIFISNVAGQGGVRDQNGRIDILLHLDNYKTKQIFLSGLNAPKGMRSKSGLLWFTDIDTVYAVNLATAKEVHKIKIKDAVFLNDIAINDIGEVFVSDTLGSKIYIVKNGKYKILSEGKRLESPNGLLWKDGKLYVASFGYTTNWKVKTKGRIYSIDSKTLDISFVTEKPIGNLDGLEFIDGDFYTTDWRAGVVLKVGLDGEAKTIISNMLGTADIGYNPIDNTLWVPRMAEDIVSVFSLD